MKSHVNTGTALAWLERIRRVTFLAGGNKAFIDRMMILYYVAA